MRTIDKYMMTDFVTNLSYEMWGTAFLSNGSDTRFNSFLDTHLRVIYLSFPYKKNRNWDY
jgi:hypothetical protein